MDVLDFIITSLLKNDTILIYGIVIAILAKIILRIFIKRLNYRNLIQSFFRIYSKFDRLEVDNEETRFGMIINNWINIYAYILFMVLVLSEIVNLLMDASKKR